MIAENFKPIGLVLAVLALLSGSALAATISVSQCEYLGNTCLYSSKALLANKNQSTTDSYKLLSYYAVIDYRCNLVTTEAACKTTRGCTYSKDVSMCIIDITSPSVTGAFSCTGSTMRKQADCELYNNDKTTCLATTGCTYLEGTTPGATGCSATPAVTPTLTDPKLTNLSDTSFWGTCSGPAYAKAVIANTQYSLGNFYPRVLGGWYWDKYVDCLKKSKDTCATEKVTFDDSTLDGLVSAARPLMQAAVFNSKTFINNAAVFRASSLLSVIAGVLAFVFVL